MQEITRKGYFNNDFTKRNKFMKTRTIIFFILILFYSSGANSQTNSAQKSQPLPDADTLLENLTLQQVRDAVYGVPYYDLKETRIHGGSGVPVKRDVEDIKKVAESPAFFIDSLFYENILDPLLEDYRDILLERFPILVFWNVSVSFKLMSVMDSLEMQNPQITADEYWEILRRDHAELINRNFERINSASQAILKEGAYRTIRAVRNARTFLIGMIFPIKHQFYPETEPYFKKLGIQPDPDIFVIPRRDTFRVIETPIRAIDDE